MTGWCIFLKLVPELNFGFVIIFRCDCISRAYPSIDVRWKVRWIIDKVSYIYSLKSMTRSFLAAKILAP